MTKRQLILEQIKVIVAQEGRVTGAALRLYVEGRISRQAFDAACGRGYAIYQRRTSQEQGQ